MKSEYLCPNVPEDVVIEILSRLPVKSLVRFRCVCKSWYALIKNPRFIAKHLLLNQCDSGTLMNSNNNASLLVMRYHSITERYVLSFLSNETLDVSVNLELRFFCEEPEAPRILGPCNGIFCVYCFDKPAVLWNPAIREFKALPLSGVPHPPATKAVYVDGLGFGFDPITNDYKVVRFVDLWFDGSNRKSTIVELYTLSTDSWKEIDAHSVLPCITMGGNTFNKKGIFHWWALDEDGLMVLSFDMGDEVFLKTPLPDCGSVVDGFSKRLAVLNESLVLVAFTFRGTESCFDIWVLNEYGLKESWTKQLTIGPILGDYSPLGFWKGDEFLLEESETGRLFSYHPTTQEIKELQVDGVPSTLQAFNYTESLVSIKGGYDHEQQGNSSDILPLPFSVHELSCII